MTMDEISQLIKSNSRLTPDVSIAGSESHQETEVTLSTNKESFVEANGSNTRPHRSKVSPRLDGDKSESRYECLVCGKSFSTLGNLTTHGRIHSGLRPFQCQVCPKTFITSSNLRTHARTHSGDKPYRCLVCEKNYSTSSNLQTHQRTHDGVRPFRCNQCSREFTTTSNLQTHLRVHTGARPYSCSQCEKHFTTSSNLRSHERIHANLKARKKVTLPALSTCAETIGTDSELGHKSVSDDSGNGTNHVAFRVVFPESVAET